MHIRFVLFDLDGTLIDSSKAHEAAYLQAIGEFDLGLKSHFHYESYLGWTTESAFHHFLGEEVGASQILALSARKRTLYLESVESGYVREFEGAEEVLESLRDHGLPLGVVTGASRSSVDAIFRMLNWSRFFSATITAGDAVRGKPHPDPYMKAVEALGLSPECGVAVEDARDGVASAKAAGLRVVLVSRQIMAQNFGATWVCSDLLESKARVLMEVGANVD